MTFIQWMKRHRTAIVESSKEDSNKTRRRRSLLINRSETLVIDETLSSSTTAAEDAPWRVEHLLPSGPPQPSDWWIKSSDSEKALVDDGDAAAPIATSDDQSSAQFRNCGLEIWNQGRSAWRNYDEVGAPDDLVDAPTILPQQRAQLSKSQRRELMRGLSTGRAYQLKQRVGLKEMVQTYNAIWSDDLE